MITKKQVVLFRNLKGDTDPLALDFFVRWGSPKNEAILSIRQFERLALYRKAINLSKEPTEIVSEEFKMILMQRLGQECEDDETMHMLMQDKWTFIDKIEYRWKTFFRKG